MRPLSAVRVGVGPASRLGVMARLAMFGLVATVLLRAALPPEVTSVSPAPRYRADRILIRPRSGVSAEALAAFHRSNRVEVARTYPALGGAQLLSIPPDPGVEASIVHYWASGLVDLAEPDYWVWAAAVPNDPQFVDQWGLHNTGKLGTVDADIDAPEAWDLLHDAPGVVVAVIDSGIRLTHEDLRTNLWVNPGEIPGNEVDDDGNGVVDDVHGISALSGTKTNDVRDVTGHGTGLAGIIGAVGHNGVGVAGVAWAVQLMGCRFLDNQGSGDIADAITCIEYARAQGAHILNCSWGGPDRSELLETALRQARDAGILVVCGAGNDQTNVDAAPFYPACLDLDNIVSVTASTYDDVLWNQANYGATTVDLAAPGLAIRTTWFIMDTSYTEMGGTSFAAAHVTGALALLRARFPNEPPRQAIQRLLATCDALPALEGKCRTGGRLNLERALSSPAAELSAALVGGGGGLRLEVRADRGGSFALEYSDDMHAWPGLATNTIAAGGAWSLTVPMPAGAPERWFRARWLP